MDNPSTPIPPIPAPTPLWQRAYLWQLVGAALFAIGGILVFCLLVPREGISITESIILGVCLLVASLFLAVISLFMCREDRRKRARWARVQSGGVPVKAQILSVYADYSAFTRRARARLSRLDCTYSPTDPTCVQQASGQAAIWLFTSERFLTPQHKFEGYVTVYVVPSSPDDYYVDLNSLEVTEVQDAPLSTSDDII